MASRKQPPARKASGRNVEEWERGTIRVRVPKEHAETLAKRWSMTPTQAVLRAIAWAAHGE